MIYFYSHFSLPYTESCLREIMRLETLVPSGLAHRTLEDTKFMGYDIPSVKVVTVYIIDRFVDSVYF